jgi:hypothetical protein
VIASASIPSRDEQPIEQTIGLAPPHQIAQRRRVLVAEILRRFEAALAE